jgi:hypothetical protein
LIDEFLLAHPDFAHEPEPYAVLSEDYSEVFAAQPSAEDFYRQLEFQVEQLRSYSAGDRVIFERCPVDFIAYMLALRDLGRDDSALRVIEGSLDIVKKAIALLDWIVFLPIDNSGRCEVSDEEDLELRAVVDSKLASLLNDDDLDLFVFSPASVVEARGSTASRLRMVENTLGI